MASYHVSYHADVEADSPEEAAEAFRQQVAGDRGSNYLVTNRGQRLSDWVTPMTKAEVEQARRESDTEWQSPGYVTKEESK